jgi:site-specific DNA-methyltransferase (adenine-specific)
LINASRKWFRYEIIWEKSIALGFLNAKKMPLRAHENILVFYRTLPTYNPQMIAGKPSKKNASSNRTELYGKHKRIFYDSKGERYPRSVQKWAQEQHRGHPTAKPQAMFEWLIKTYTYPRDTVLDNCMGSGTTAAACEATGRRWIGIELDERVCEIARKRIIG